MNKYLLIIASVFFAANLRSQTIYVSPSGNDKNPGTKAKPVASFSTAQSLVRKLPKTKTSEVIFTKGVYYLPQTMVFTAVDSKNPGAIVTYRSEIEGEAILSGGSLLNLNWQPAEKGIFVAKVSENTIIDQLYINGIRQRMARFPNAVEGKHVFDTWELSHNAKTDVDNDPLSLERISRFKNPEGGYIHSMHSALWGDMHWIIKGKNADGTLNFEGGWQNNRPSPMHPLYRMVENIFEELDVLGEWFFNANDLKLYYFPEANTDLKTAKVEIVRLKHLIEFNGTKENPVSHVQLKGFVFRHTARTFMDNKEPLLRSDWTVYRGGAVVYNGAEDCSITDCEFDQVGGNTIFVNNYNRRITIRGCYLQNSGANGIAFVGDPSAVRSPLFNYEQKFDYEKIDRTPGPATDNYPADCVVEDCLITRSGRFEKQTAPVEIDIAKNITVRHCSIYDVPRAGINIGDGCWGGHIIEGCDIFNTVLETGDHGSFNSWGRDRYWHPDMRLVDKQVAANTALPLLDAQSAIIIRNNRWRCDHGWDIDLDDGSSNYHIYNNLLLNGGLKLREGYSRKVTNNIIINNTLHPHCWYGNSGDVFSRNIVTGPYRPARLEIAQWGTETDRNFFVSGVLLGEGKFGSWGEKLGRKNYLTSDADRTKFAAKGCDMNSISGDPQFLNATLGDFRVKKGSSALSLGFENFPMDNFGVRSARLKAIARTPAIPLVTFGSLKANSAVAAPVILSWHGATLRELEGLEFSALGVAESAAGVFIAELSVPSGAYAVGLRRSDLVQRINGRAIKSLAEFKEAVKASGDAMPFKFEIIRNQQPLTLESNSIVLTPMEAMPVTIAEGDCKPDWKSLGDHFRVPKWWREAKIGMWLHWGPQSVGEDGDWYAKWIYMQKGHFWNNFEQVYGNHLKRFGHPSESGYKDALLQWKAEKWDPGKLMALYKRAGARYVIAQGMHHDNFDLWNSKFQPWNSVKLGPQRDILGDWKKAADKEGIRFGIAFHGDYSLWWQQPAFLSDIDGPLKGVPYDGAQNYDGNDTWWKKQGLSLKDLYGIDLKDYVVYPVNFKGDSVEFRMMDGAHGIPDGNLKKNIDFARWYATKWTNRVVDAIDQFSPDFIYFDGGNSYPFCGFRTGRGLRSDATPRVIAHLYNTNIRKNGGQLEAMAFTKGNEDPRAVAINFESRFPVGIKRDQPWQTEVGLGEWFYYKGTFYETGMVIHQMLEAISRDGNYAINIPLTPAGDLDPGGLKTLQEMGEWMDVNSEGIHGSSAWDVWGEGNVIMKKGNLDAEHAATPYTAQDIRFTVNKGCLYAWLMAWPENGEVIIRSLGKQAGKVTSVEMLGCNNKLVWKHTSEGLVVHLPAAKPCRFAYGIKVTGENLKADNQNAH
jgi:alpha-L-fucosidase